MSKGFNIKGKGLIVVISGPSGTGKDTVIGEILKENDDICMSISATTRDPRAYEKDGGNYHFLSEESFKEVVKKGKMLEYARYCGNYYGTLSDFVGQKIESGVDVILKIEVNGARQIRENCPDAVHIFILPPSIKELQERLKSRKTETKESFEQRFGLASQEMALAADYDYIVVNKDRSACARDIWNIICAEKLRTSRIKNRTDHIIKEVLYNG
ncbi:MAG: guanylate kinase [Oscillospiraceae bacterium]|jgi:guanylate kinase|nr:guanylate kinase [Oscillospiraceae bacterium]